MFCTSVAFKEESHSQIGLRVWISWEGCRLCVVAAPIHHGSSLPAVLMTLCGRWEVSRWHHVFTFILEWIQQRYLCPPMTVSVSFRFHFLGVKHTHPHQLFRENKVEQLQGARLQPVEPSASEKSEMNPKFRVIESWSRGKKCLHDLTKDTLVKMKAANMNVFNGYTVYLHTCSVYYRLIIYCPGRLSVQYSIYPVEDLRPKNEKILKYFEVNIRILKGKISPCGCHGLFLHYLSASENKCLWIHYLARKQHVIYKVSSN